LDRKAERQHELNMVSLEHDFAKTQAEVALRIGHQQVQVREFEAIAQASEEQSRTSVAAGWLIAAINALVRPLTTYLFLGCYFLVKAALYSMAVTQGGAWQQVIVSLWTADDATILFMIISFWFVGRVYERKPN
jgi:hydrogenase maturation factor HypE